MKIFKQEKWLIPYSYHFVAYLRIDIHETQVGKLFIILLYL